MGRAKRDIKGRERRDGTTIGNNRKIPRDKES